MDVAKVVIRPQGLLRRNPYKNRYEQAKQLVCKKHSLAYDCEIVLCVGYVDRRKGADLFVEVAHAVLQQRPRVVFIWVGHAERELEQEVRQRISQLGYQASILFVGFDKEPMAYYAAASVYALTSREDPFPNVVIESAEVGVPVVAFENTTGAANFILDQGGQLARNLDPNDFADKVLELLSNKHYGKTPPIASLRQYALDLMHHLNGFARVSVVVPNYNYAHHIARRLDSITCQSYPYYQLVVLDDASTDNGVSVACTYLEDHGCDAELIVNTTNSGSVFRQWCKGIAHSKGDLVWIAEADDLSEDKFLETLVPAFEDPDMVLAYTQSKQIDENDNLLATDYLDYTNDISDDWQDNYVRDGREEIGLALHIKNTLPNVSAVLFRRESLTRALTEIGEELYSYRVAGDWLVYLHVLKQGRLCFCAKAYNLHRRHTASVTKSTHALQHYQEICRVQQYAREISSPATGTLHKAEVYNKYLLHYLGLEPA